MPSAARRRLERARRASYRATSIDNEIMGLLADLSEAEKMKLIKMIRIWKDK